MAKLKETYVKDIAPALYKKFGYKSVMQIPKLDKVVVNVGCGEARDNHKIIGRNHGRPGNHHRPESCSLCSEKIRCELQTS